MDGRSRTTAEPIDGSSPVLPVGGAVDVPPTFVHTVASEDGDASSPATVLNADGCRFERRHPSTDMDTEPLSVDLPNVGEGPDPTSPIDLVADSDFLVLLLMQSHHSGTCRQQAREIADRYDDFRRLNARVAAIVPGSRPQLRSWRSLVDPPFPVLADDETVIGEAFRQPRRYGPLGRLVDSFGRMPMTVVLDCRGDDTSVYHVYEGEASVDRPSVHELLDVLRESDA